MSAEQKAFVLAYPTLVNKHYIGVLCRELENNRLTIIGMKYMSVNSDFAKIHMRRPGRVDQEASYPEDWLQYLSECPMVILLLKGEKAIELARQVTTKLWLLGWGQRPKRVGGHCYSSLNAVNAAEDIEMWFDEDYDKWSEEYCLSKDLVYVFRDKVLGDEKRAPFCYEYLGYECYEDLYYQDNQVFIVIRPVAVQARLVGQIINAFERNAYGRMRGAKILPLEIHLVVFELDVHQNQNVNFLVLLGLKRVSMKELPEDIAWSGDSSSSETAVNDDDDVSSFGIAMVFEKLGIDGRIILTDKGGNHFFFDPETFTHQIDRNLIHISKPGPDAWELIKKCFHFGFVIRPTIDSIAILEASLNGLSTS